MEFFTSHTAAITINLLLQTQSSMGLGNRVTIIFALGSIRLISIILASVREERPLDYTEWRGSAGDGMRGGGGSAPFFSLFREMQSGR